MIVWIFLGVAALLAFYILLGYPLLLAVFWKREAPMIRKDLSHLPTVTVILAVYNGARFIKAKLETLLSLDYPPEKINILVVSDGSTDETEAIVQASADVRVKLLSAPRGGKAAAVNVALEQAIGEVLFFTDVRQPLDRSALRHLVANFADPTVGAVTGEMRLLKGEGGEQVDMDMYWRYELWARTRHSTIYSLFNTTGCVYAMRRELAKPMRPDTLSDDAVLPLGAYFQGYRIIFDPAAIAYDYPAVSGTEFRRRFRNLAGLYQVHFWFPQLFGGGNRMRIHFLSHKFGRLLLPWAIMGIYIATALLSASGLRLLLIMGEALPILLALVDPLVPAGGRWKRVTSPARTFIGMNIVSMAAIAVIFLPTSVLWKPTQVNPLAEKRS